MTFRNEQSPDDPYQIPPTTGPATRTEKLHAHWIVITERYFERIHNIIIALFKTHQI